MSYFIVAMTNQVERTKCVSLRNNEQQNLRQALTEDVLKANLWLGA